MEGMRRSGHYVRYPLPAKHLNMASPPAGRKSRHQYSVGRCQADRLSPPAGKMWPGHETTRLTLHPRKTNSSDKHPHLKTNSDPFLSLQKYF